jgi:hypothetical protein
VTAPVPIPIAGGSGGGANEGGGRQQRSGLIDDEATPPGGGGLLEGNAHPLSPGTLSPQGHGALSVSGVFKRVTELQDTLVGKDSATSQHHLRKCVRVLTFLGRSFRWCEFARRLARIVARSLFRGLLVEFTATTRITSAVLSLALPLGAVQQVFVAGVCLLSYLLRFICFRITWV